MPHRRQINLAHHLPGTGAEAPAHPNKYLVDLAHSSRRIQRHRKEAGNRPHGDLRSGANAEPHDHDWKEDDLRTGSQIIEIRLIGAGQEFTPTERDSNGKAAQAADQDGNADLGSRGGEMKMESRV